MVPGLIILSPLNLKTTLHFREKKLSTIFENTFFPKRNRVTEHHTLLDCSEFFKILFTKPLTLLPHLPLTLIHSMIGSILQLAQRFSIFSSPTDQRKKTTASASASTYAHPQSIQSIGERGAFDEGTLNYLNTDIGKSFSDLSLFDDTSEIQDDRGLVFPRLPKALPLCSSTPRCYKEFQLQTPRRDDCHGAAGETLTYYYYSSSAAKCASSVTASSFRSHIVSMLESCTSDSGIFIGFKTESDSKGKIQFIQLSSHNVAIILHRRSGLFQSSPLRDLLSNKIPGRENRIVFCGADLAAQAIRLLGLVNVSSPMKLHRALDISPIYSNYLNSKGPPYINAARAKTIPPALGISPMDLQEMASEVICKGWERKSYLEDSTDWSKDTLSLEQLELLAMDAWVSAALGIHLRKKIPYVLEDAFSTYYLMYSDVFYKLFQHAEAIEDLKEEVPASVSNMQPIGRKTLRMHCAQYASSLRQRQIVEIRIVSPGGCKEGVLVNGRVMDVKGKVSTVDILDVLSCNDYVAADKRMYNSLIEQPSNAIYQLFLEDDRKYGPYSKSKEMGGKNKFRVRVYFIDNGDIPLRQVSDFLKHVVRSHTLLSGENPTKSFFQVMGNSLSVGCVFDAALLEGGDIPLTEEAIRLLRLKEKALTTQQFGSLVNAFTHRISIIQGTAAFVRYAINVYPILTSTYSGPPGTGKTRTIAAISEVATSLRRRGNATLIFSFIRGIKDACSQC